jgi:hypothetical protein
MNGNEVKNWQLVWTDKMIKSTLTDGLKLSDKNMFQLLSDATIKSTDTLTYSKLSDILNPILAKANDARLPGMVLMP